MSPHAQSKRDLTYVTTTSAHATLAIRLSQNLGHRCFADGSDAKHDTYATINRIPAQ